MSNIDQNLDWRKRANEFDSDEKRVLIALSFKKYLWRTMDNLQAVTNLDYDVLADTLTQLLREDLVVGSYNYRIREPVFGLVERNDPAYIRRRKAAERRAGNRR